MTAPDEKEGPVPGTMDQTTLAGGVGGSRTSPSGPGPRPGSDDAAEPGLTGLPPVLDGRGAQNHPEGPAQPSGRVRTWYLRAAEHHNSGRPDRAAELLVSAVRLDPCLGCLREALARAQFDAKQYLAARTTFTAMTAIDPGDHYGLYGLGLVETRLGAHEAAARHLERALCLHPGDRRYALALEHARAALGPAADDPAADVTPGHTDASSATGCGQGSA